MSRLLTLNLDFVLMLQSGLLCLLASTAWSLRRFDPKRAWQWFAWFAVAQMVQTWIEMITLGDVVSVWPPVVRTMLRVTSYLCLLEFARASSTAKWGKWIHLPVVAALTLAVIAGGNVGGTWSRFAVAALAGAWSAITLWNAGTLQRTVGRSGLLRVVAVLLFGYQLLIALPRVLITPDDFAELVGLPLTVARAAFALMLTLALFQCRNLTSDLGINAAQAKATRRRRAICGVVILLIGVAGWVAADLSGRRQENAMRHQILARTQLAAAVVPLADVRDLHWDGSDLGRPSYERLKVLMMSLRQANPDVRFVLLNGVRQGKSYFLVDSESPESGDYSPPGQSYDEAPADYLAGMLSRQTFLNGPYTDRWGTWVSGSVPLLDAHGDTGVDMELDIAAADWDALIQSERLPMLLITLLIAALVAGAYRALEDLRESAAQITLSEQRNRSLVEGSPDTVQMFDSGGRYVAVNQNGLRALGLTEAQVFGRRFEDVWPTESRPAIAEAVRRTLAGQPTSLEAEYTRPDGRVLTWRVATNPVFDAAGRVISFVGICVDLTDRKLAEVAMLAAKRAAEEATQAKSEFLAVMSHEIRTPLAGVIGMLELLQQSPLETKPRRYTEFARESADGLLHLLDDVLDSAKFEAGKVALEAIEFRPHQAFHVAFESAAMRAATKGLSLRHAVTPAVPAVLIGDPTRLRQVINNLVNNALKFTEKGGVNVTLDATPSRPGYVQLKIIVRDTGIGIPEDVRCRLFTQFTQAESSTTRRFGGTGLGLSIVKNLAGLMGGQVDVESVVGKGSTFTFRADLAQGRDRTQSALPFVISANPASRPLAPTRSVAGSGGPVNAAAAAAKSAPLKSSRPLRVLIVDDDEANRAVAEALVTSLAHHVAFATNGREAVDLLIKEKFDVVLMDNRMPVMDGFAATKAIRDRATGATDPEIYIIALTANASPDDRAKCLAASMNDFATKPVRGPAMSAALDRAILHLQRRGLLSPSTPPPAAPASAGQLPAGLSADELLASLDEPAPTAPAASPDLSAATRHKLTGIFLRETPRRLRTLHDYLNRGDASAFGIEAHALKGNARYFDASHLGDVAAQMEQLADAGNLGALAPLLAESERAFAELQTKLEQPVTT